MEPRSEVFNGRCSLLREGDLRVIVVSGVAAYRYFAGDQAGRAYAMVFLVESGYATQREVARVYGASERTIRRYQRRYEEGGMSALVTRSGWPAGRRRMPTKRRLRIERMLAEGLSNREIARRVGVSEKAIRKQVGPSQGVATQIPLPFPLGVDTASEPEPARDRRGEDAVLDAGEKETSSATVTRVPGSLDSDPRNRVLDRTMARIGRLNDAAPMFVEADNVMGAGVLFALPPLVQSGVFRVAAKLYDNIGPAFYGLRTTFLTLLFMALWRIKCPENLKERDPASLGLVLGLDRAPEVKTVRRKLTRLAAAHKAEKLGQELAQIRVEQREAMMGFLYVDGHVRAYHGKRDIPKTHVARMRISMPAVSDYWVGDAAGDPLFVVTAEANAGLTQMLPPLLEQVRDLVGERAVTVVFDRGGWKLELFRQIVNDLGFDILTYRKGKSPDIEPGLFAKQHALIDGRRVEYLLHDQRVTFLKGKLELRQVTRLKSDHQTQIITSRFDLPAAGVAFRMFERWRQENYFRYSREEFALDALADYQIEPGDPTRTVPNPARKELAKKIKAVRLEIKSLEQKLGAELIQAKEKNLPGVSALAGAYKNAEALLQASRNDLDALRQEQHITPTRVEIRDLAEDAVIKLATERKHLTNVLKMLAYQAESDLLALLDPYFSRNEDEGRTLIHEILGARADLRVTEENELCVNLHPLSAPRRTEAVSRICQSLNESNTTYPGSKLRLRFQVKPSPKIGLAFPGSTLKQLNRNM